MCVFLETHSNWVPIKCFAEIWQIERVSIGRHCGNIWSCFIQISSRWRGVGLFPSNVTFVCLFNELTPGVLSSPHRSSHSLALLSSPPAHHAFLSVGSMISSSVKKNISTIFFKRFLNFSKGFHQANQNLKALKTAPNRNEALKKMCGCSSRANNQNFVFYK